MNTLEITNFQGRLSRYNNGDINSGFAKYSTTFGNDPFSQPERLTWFEAPIAFDTGAESTLQDLIVAARPRLENGVTYVYAVGHTGRIYKIQVNDPTTFNPNYDNPVLLTTLTINSPTFKFGSSIQFFGATERLYIGHDIGVTRVDFDGTNETFVGNPGTWVQNVPRPSGNFVGSTFWGNGANIAEIDETATVTDYTRIDPAFPNGTYVRDIDVNPEGNYLIIVVSRINSPDLTAIAQDTTSLSSSDSYLMYWNGIDQGVTSYSPFNSYIMNGNISFGPYSYTVGYDSGGAAIYMGGSKVVSLPVSQTPNFEAMFSAGNMFGFTAPENNKDFLKATLMSYGNYDEEIPKGLYRYFRQSASGTETDVIQMPVCQVVSNLFYGSSYAGYVDNQVGSAKLYYSTLETSATTGDTTSPKYGFYWFTTVPTGNNPAIEGIYETQNQVFSKKVSVSQVRVYTEPLIANNSFSIDLIGSANTPITNGSYTFTVGTNTTAGQDYCWYDPGNAPTYALGVRVTNTGSKNFVINKIEVDYDQAGK